ncbi:hypothetical protein IC232_26230 [Microvirga sp. BT688]|uniref:hypothetical protein n=1 Tax=Microvirga sp. TaxID=1873136 RepID=UPI0016874C05|nr:hypothetical protein [Microvirga sp.]MBD2750168.1 hypothetical protein [Microvirga sp.]
MSVRVGLHALGIVLVSILPLRANDSAPPQGVVLVGHSLVNHDMPQILRKLGPRGSTTQEQVINGATMWANWDHAEKAEGINARTVLARGDTDVLIVTEAIPLQNHIKWSDSYGYALKWRNAAIDANSKTRVYLYETWHSLEAKAADGSKKSGSLSDLTDWRIQLDKDLPKWEEIARRGQMTGLVPAGQALGAMYDAVQTGNAAGLTSITQLFSDDIHLNSLGNYFVACVQYSVIYRVSPVGLQRQLVNQWGVAYKPPSEALAMRMQQIAWEVVSRYRFSN